VPDANAGGEFKLTVPEGMPVDAKFLEQATALFRADGLTPEQAQKYVDLQVASLKEVDRQANEKWEADEKGWVKALQDDPKWGGGKYQDTIAISRKAMQAADPQLVKDLKAMGLTNLPSLVRTFASFGVRLTEDSSRGAGGGGGPPPAPPTLPEKLSVVYDSPDMKRGRKAS